MTICVDEWTVRSVVTLGMGNNVIVADAQTATVAIRRSIDSRQFDVADSRNA